jgi:hypothetical protein
MTWDDTDPGATPTFHHASITGDPAAVKQFYVEMQGQMRITNLEDAWMACPLCSLYASGGAPGNLDFYYVHGDRPKYFNAARDKVVAAGMTVILVLDDNLIGMSAGGCPASPPAPAGCVPAPTCSATFYCDRYQGMPCQRCAY